MSGDCFVFLIECMPLLVCIFFSSLPVVHLGHRLCDPGLISQPIPVSLVDDNVLA